MIVQEDGLPVEDLRAKGVSGRVINAIDAAMQTRRKRTQSVAEFLRNLESKDEGEATVITTNIPKTEEESSSKIINLSNISNSSSVKPYKFGRSLSFFISAINWTSWL